MSRVRGAGWSGAAWLVVAALVGACVKAPEAQVGPPESSAAPRPWVRASFGKEGITVTMPGQPEVRQRYMVMEHGGELYFNGLEAVDGDDTTPDYAAWRLRLSGEWPDEALTPEGLLAMVLSNVEASSPPRPLTHQGFEGRAVEGREEGVSGWEEAVLARAFVVGGSAYLLTVKASPSRLDRASAERFFGSFEISLPWRLHAHPEAGFTVAVPDAAVLLGQPEETEPEEADALQLLELGGEERLLFTVFHREGPASWLGALESDAGRRLQALLENEMHGASRRPYEGVTSVRLSEGRGWELRGRLSEGGLHFCTRVVFTGEGLIALSVASTREDVQNDPRAARFFGSLRVRRQR